MSDGSIPYTTNNGFTTWLSLEDRDLWEKYSWYGKRIQHYAKESFHIMANVRNKNGKMTTVTLHRLILLAPKGICVDHVDGDALNNCRSNLRLANHSQNGANRPPPSNNTSGYAGVKVQQGIRGTRYTALANISGKTLTFGTFGSAKEAARAYDRAKIARFGEYAKTNGMEGHLTREEWLDSSLEDKNLRALDVRIEKELSKLTN